MSIIIIIIIKSLKFITRIIVKKVLQYVLKSSICHLEVPIKIPPKSVEKLGENEPDDSNTWLVK